MSATTERALAMQAAATDLPRALVLARKVSDPWFRCQALAEVARHAPDAKTVRIANEAVKAAREDGEAYRRVAVCAWPLHSLLERGRSRQATSLAAELLPLAISLPHHVNRMDALALLWPATQGLPRATRQEWLEAQLAACAAANPWKAGRTLRNIVQILAQEDRNQARRIASTMPEGAYKRQALRLLDEAEHQERHE